MINNDDCIIELDEVDYYSFELLDEFYHSELNDPFSTNSIAFKLIYSAIYYEPINSKVSAKLYCYAAYYLFMWIKPACSCELAIYYIDKAITLNPTEKEYLTWKKLFEEGN